MEKKENLLDIVKVLYQWRKPILYLCIGIGLLTALISLLLPNYYASTTTFYAASMDQAKPGQIFGTSTAETDFYGNDRDNDRLLTIAESKELVTYMIQQFDLYTHYEIRPTAKDAAFKVNEKFLKHYTVTKTKRDAIQLSIEDTDREKAALMVNAARVKVDEQYIKIVTDQLTTLKGSLEKNIQEKDKTLQQISDSLQIIRNRYGIYSATNQGEVIAEQLLTTESKLIRESAKLAALGKMATISRDTLSLLRADVKGYEQEVKALKEQLTLFNQGLSTVLILERQQKEVSNRLGFQKIQLNQLITAFDSPLTGINLIEAGTVPTRKSRPSRSIIVISAVMISFIFSIIGLLLFDAYKEVDWKEVFSA